MRRHSQGFSLLELSIVIVLIGLVAGIVMMGQGLGQRSKLQAVMGAAQQYAAAINQFETQYGSLPGDMRNATEVWGRAATPLSASQCANPATNSFRGRTCNGNGNGLIEIPNANASCEPYRAWEQLAIAKFIGGNYTGTSGTSGVGCAPNSVPEVNSPKSIMEGTTFSITSYPPNLTTHAILLDGDYFNVLLFGAVLAGNYSLGPALTGSEAREIDEKLDDRTPLTGNIRGVKDPCTTAEGIYNESNSNPVCAIIFMQDFMKPRGY